MHGNGKLAGVGEVTEYEVPAAASRSLYDTSVREQAAIVSWRSLCFCSVGFTFDVSLALARRRDIDRLRVEQMLERGATHDQVVDILT